MRKLHGSLLLVLSCSTSLFAQENWSGELRPGIHFATSELGNADLKTGLGFEAVLAYRLMPHLEAYAGGDGIGLKAKEFPLQVVARNLKQPVIPLGFSSSTPFQQHQKFPTS